MRERLKGFTLIELLIVVAIIAILAAIAVPNFLEAQVRSKVSRAKADLRSAATAVESYVVDWNKGFNDPTNGGILTPGWTGANQYNSSGFPKNVAVETGVALQGIQIETSRDPATGAFTTRSADSPIGTNLRWAFRTYANWSRLTTPVAYITSPPIDAFASGIPAGYESNRHPQVAWCSLYEMGPDREIGDAQGYPSSLYDPTNGTVSNGDIMRFCAIKDIDYMRVRYGNSFDPNPR